MNKAIVFGANGMLGRYVCKYLGSIGIEILPVTRKQCDINQSDIDIIEDIRNLLPSSKLESLSDYVIINCAGIIKSRPKISIFEYVSVNTLFPHILDKLSDRYNSKLIHITTDCVFDGSLLLGEYNELSAHNPTDIYGKTKSLGEPENATVIRTSIIGEEVGNNRSLIEWAKANRGNNVNGYTNHLWNGVTCLQLSKIIGKIICESLYWKGVRHIFTPTYITKYNLIKLISEVYSLNLNIKEVNADVYVNRRLSTIYTQNSMFEFPYYTEQLTELYQFSIV